MMKQIGIQSTSLQLILALRFHWFGYAASTLASLILKPSLHSAHSCSMEVTMLRYSQPGAASFALICLSILMVSPSALGEQPSQPSLQSLQTQIDALQNQVTSLQSALNKLCGDGANCNDATRKLDVELVKQTFHKRAASVGTESVACPPGKKVLYVTGTAYVTYPGKYVPVLYAIPNKDRSGAEVAAGEPTGASTLDLTVYLLCANV